MLDLDNMTAIDVVLNGNTIALTEVEVIKNGIATTVWRAEFYAFQNGSLASGITNSGFEGSGTSLHLGIGADNNSEESASAKIQNVDLTNYSKLDIVVDYRTYANYGDSSVSYGIDNCWATGLPNSNNNVVTTTITIDISSITGKHYIGFGVWARNDSSEPTWHASADVWIKEIRLYN